MLHPQKKFIPKPICFGFGNFIFGGHIMKKSKLSKITIAALFGAMSFVLMFFSFSVPILSPVAEFDASALPELIGGFILGPSGAVGIISIKLL